jgi:hypothetical protein
MDHVFKLRATRGGDPDRIACAVCDDDKPPLLIEEPQVLAGPVASMLRPVYHAYCADCVEREKLQADEHVSAERIEEMRRRKEDRDFTR